MYSPLFLVSYFDSLAPEVLLFTRSCLFLAFKRTRKFSRCILFLYSFSFITGLVAALLTIIRVLALKVFETGPNASQIAWMTYSIIIVNLVLSLSTVFFLMVIICCLGCKSQPKSEYAKTPVVTNVTGTMDATQVVHEQPNSRDFNSSTIKSYDNYTLNNPSQLQNLRNLQTNNSATELSRTEAFRM